MCVCKRRGGGGREEKKEGGSQGGGGFGWSKLCNRVHSTVKYIRVQSSRESRRKTPLKHNHCEHDCQQLCFQTGKLAVHYHSPPPPPLPPPSSPSPLPSHFQFHTSQPAPPLLLHDRAPHSQHPCSQNLRNTCSNTITFMNTHRNKMKSNSETKNVSVIQHRIYQVSKHLMMILVFFLKHSRSHF